MRHIFTVTACLCLLFLTHAVAQTDPDQRRIPLPYPFARGSLTKLDISTHTLTVNTDSGSKNFLFTAKTYIFRGKQKITPDQLKLGELVKLNYTTNELGEAIARRIKVTP